MSIYEIITERIVKSLESGVVPWHKPWSTSMPMNLVSKKPYRGINPFLLSLQNRKSKWWMSLKQANALGGKVKKGEKSTLVIWWSWVPSKEIDEDTGKPKKVPMLRYYNVFNLDQTEGIEAPEEVTLNFTPIQQAESVITGYPNPPKFKEEGDRACYSPFEDEITMPLKEKFVGVEEYYSTYFHEMVHSTGHQKRLKREGVATREIFNDHEYGEEELVAEMGASFLQAETGITTPAVQKNSEAYIKHWLQQIRGDAKLIVHASAKAQRAVDHIFNRKWEDEAEE